MAPAGGRRIDQRNTTNLDLLVEANLDLLVDALSLHYCHSLGVRKIGEQRQTNGSQRHQDGSAQNPADPTSKSAVSPAESIRDRKEECSEHSEHRTKGSAALGYGPYRSNAGDDERCVCFRRRVKRQPAAA
jgi:hypothetical protein